MDGYSLQVLLTQGIIILVLFGLIFYLLRQRRVITLEKRFERFSLNSIQDMELSFFDILIRYLWKVVHKISSFLSHSVFLKRYSDRYEKYIVFDKKDEIFKMDFVSIKFLISLAVFLLYFASTMFHVVNFSFFRLFFTGILGFFLTDIVLQFEYMKRRKKIEEDLLKAIIMMNNSFKAGRNIMQAVEVVKNELDGPIRDEFRKIYLDMTYGLSLEVVFDRFSNRVKLEDAKYITSSLTLLNRTGGNIVRVFGTIEKSFFDKKKLQKEMMSLTSASTFMFRILLFLPFLFVLVIFLLNPSYFNPVFETTLGHIILGFTIFLYLLYIYVIKKVLEVRIS